MGRYKIPLKDSLVVGHVNPDGDSLSSVKAVLNYLRANGKKAYGKVVGPVPEHLAWVLPEEDLPPDIPKVEQTIVLDCAPTPDRVGFDINGPIINIDHHTTRLEEHNTKKKIYVKDRCSTAAMLILDFDIVDYVLLVGLYTDTLFSRYWEELVKCFNVLSIPNEKAEQIMSAIRPTRYMQALIGIKHAKLHKCRNGFLIVESNEKDPLVINEMMDTLFRYSENVCLLNGDQQAKLRTSNKTLIESGALAEIAKLFKGGGHAMACVADATNKKTTLFGLIKQLEIIPDKIELDGYEEHKE